MTFKMVMTDLIYRRSCIKMKASIKKKWCAETASCKQPVKGKQLNILFTQNIITLTYWYWSFRGRMLHMVMRSTPVTNSRLMALKLPPRLSNKLFLGLVVAESALQPGDVGDGHVAQWSSEGVSKAFHRRRRKRPRYLAFHFDFHLSFRT